MTIHWNISLEKKNPFSAKTPPARDCAQNFCVQKFHTRLYEMVRTAFNALSREAWMSLKHI